MLLNNLGSWQKFVLDGYVVRVLTAPLISSQMLTPPVAPCPLTTRAYVTVSHTDSS